MAYFDPNMILNQWGAYGQQPIRRENLGFDVPDEGGGGAGQGGGHGEGFTYPQDTTYPQGPAFPQDATYPQYPTDPSGGGSYIPVRDPIRSFGYATGESPVIPKDYNGGYTIRTGRSYYPEVRNYSPPLSTPPKDSGGGQDSNGGPGRRVQIPGTLDPKTTYPWPDTGGLANSKVGTAAPSGYTGTFQTANPLQMSEEDRLAAKGWWDALENDTIAAQNAYQGRENDFLKWQLGGPGGYSQILSGQGGYGTEEQQRLLQQKLLENGLASPDELDALNLTQDEMRTILGDPYAAREIIAGKLTALEGSQTEATKRQREAYQSLQGRLDDVANRESLGLSPGYGAQQFGYIGNLAHEQQAAIDPSKMNLSSDFLNRYNWTPEDTNRLVSQAGRTIGIRGQAERDALNRDAWAAGNVSPMSIEAMASRNKLVSDIGAADAMTAARIAAKQNELNTAKTREQMRLEAQYGLTDRQLAAAESIAGKQLTQGEAVEVLRQQAERDRATRSADAAKTGELTRLDTERGIGQSEQDLGRYGTNMIFDATKYGEAAGSQRAQDLAKNRQGVGQSNLATRFGQASSTSQDLANRWANILGQKKTEEQEGRSFLGKQQAAGQEGAITSRQQRIGSAGQGFGAINTATGQSIAAKLMPTWLEKWLPG